MAPCRNSSPSPWPGSARWVAALLASLPVTPSPGAFGIAYGDRYAAGQSALALRRVQVSAGADSCPQLQGVIRWMTPSLRGRCDHFARPLWAGKASRCPHLQLTGPLRFAPHMSSPYACGSRAAPHAHENRPLRCAPHMPICFARGSCNHRASPPMCAPPPSSHLVTRSSIPSLLCRHRQPEHMFIRTRCERRFHLCPLH
jgi:hypothetical protein